MPRCSCIGAICFWWACPARERRRSAGSSPGGWAGLRRRRHRARAAARRVDPDDIRDRGRGELSRPRAGGARRPRASQQDIVLATGGGVVLRPANRERLKTNGTVVYLHAEPPRPWNARVGRSRHRPLLNNTTDQLARLRELYGIRDVALPRGRRLRRRVRARRPGAVHRAARGRAARRRPCRDRRHAHVDVALGERSYPIAIGSRHPHARRRAPRRAASVAPRGHRLEPGGRAALARAPAREPRPRRHRGAGAADPRRRGAQELDDAARRAHPAARDRRPSARRRSSRWAAASSATSRIRRGDLPARACRSCRSRRRCWRRSTRRSAARPRSTTRWART